LEYLKIQSQTVTSCPLNAGTLHTFVKTRYRVPRDKPSDVRIRPQIGFTGSFMGSSGDWWNDEGGKRVVNSRASYLSFVSVTSNK